MAQSLNKSRKVLQTAYSWYLKKSQRIKPELVSSLEQQMVSLERSINDGHAEEADSQAKKIEGFYKEHCKKSPFDYITEFTFAIIIAVLVAVVVRQMWFEPHVIPSGSMRPTFFEQDHVAVTKTPFGLNIPLTTGHFYFDPNLVQRGGGTTFTSEGVEGLDEDTMFLYVIPYKKRLIKRMIGKPGDSLYFYGGKIYGLDSNDKPIEELIDGPWAKNLEHIPFIHFGMFGNNQGSDALVTFNQSGQPLGRIAATPSGIETQIFRNGKWVKDNPQTGKKNQPQTYSDFFGIENYAMARLLTKKQLGELKDVDTKNIGEGVLYLELRHHPKITIPVPLIQQSFYIDTLVKPERSIIPLSQSDLDKIMANMYTARMVFQNGRGARYSDERINFGADSPRFPDVPNGTFEFYFGKLKQVGFGSITYEAPQDHPLYSHDPENVQKLFNLGMEMRTLFDPQGASQHYYPSRYAYFRDGNLYLLGGEVLSKDNPALIDFNKREQQREATSKTYTAFKDNGIPDKERIKAFGLKIPDKKYYLLGDNHANSSDSRVFGPIPEDNLQGAPYLIMWPPGDRLGYPDQNPYPFMNLPRAIVWVIAALVFAIWYFFHRRYLHRPIVLKSQNKIARNIK